MFKQHFFFFSLLLGFWKPLICWSQKCFLKWVGFGKLKKKPCRVLRKSLLPGNQLPSENGLTVHLAHCQGAQLQCIPYDLILGFLKRWEWASTIIWNLTLQLGDIVASRLSATGWGTFKPRELFWPCPSNLSSVLVPEFLSEIYEHSQSWFRNHYPSLHPTPHSGCSSPQESPLFTSTPSTHSTYMVPRSLLFSALDRFSDCWFPCLGKWNHPAHPQTHSHCKIHVVQALANKSL